MKPQEVAEMLYNISPGNDLYKVGINTVEVVNTRGRRIVKTFILSHIDRFDAKIQVYGENFIIINLGLAWSSSRFRHVITKKTGDKELVTERAKSDIHSLCIGSMDDVFDGRFASQEAFDRIAKRGRKRR